MEITNITHEIALLPPEAQQQVADFIAFLRTRYPVLVSEMKTPQIKLMDEPFIGMWQDREDMRDSSAWVSNLRQREWERLDE